MHCKKHMIVPECFSKSTSAEAANMERQQWHLHMRQRQVGSFRALPSTHFCSYDELLHSSVLYEGIRTAQDSQTQCIRHVPVVCLYIQQAPNHCSRGLLFTRQTSQSVNPQYRG